MFKVVCFLIVVGVCRYVVADGGKYGDKCTYNSCDSSFYCQESLKKCGCIEGKYDPKVGKCLLAIGDKCDESSHCPPYTTCEELDVDIIPDSVKAHFSQHRRTNWGSGVRVCNCLDGFETNLATHKCEPTLKFNEPCSDAKKKGYICDRRKAHLACAPSGTCQCALNTTVYDPVWRRCVLPLGGRCAGTMFQCPQNAWCSMNNDDNPSRYSPENYGHPPSYEEQKRNRLIAMSKNKCECIYGYKVTSAGKCLPDYHVECSKNSPCYHESMACINGICQCKGGLNGNFIKHGNSSECYLLVGGACSKDSPKCAPSSTCIKGHCACDAGLFEGLDGRCHLSHGSVCNPPVTVGWKVTVPEPHCDQMKGMACVEGKCACVDAGLKFNVKRGLCMAGEGGRCGKLEMTEKVERDVSLAYPTHPFVSPPHPFGERHEARDESQTHFIVPCEDGFECIQQTEFSQQYGMCVKKHKK